MRRLMLVMVILSAVSCVQFDMDEILMVKDDISLTVKGEDQFEYNPLTWQISNDITGNEYRVFDDKLSFWFILKCDTRPLNEGQEVQADIMWTAGKTEKSMEGLSFRVEKTDAEGKIWMWCRQKSIGIVIKNL